MGTVPCPEVRCTNEFPKPFGKQSQEDAVLPLKGSWQERSGCLGRKRANPLKEKWSSKPSLVAPSSSSSRRTAFPIRDPIDDPIGRCTVESPLPTNCETFRDCKPFRIDVPSATITNPSSPPGSLVCLQQLTG